MMDLGHGSTVYLALGEGCKCCWRLRLYVRWYLIFLDGRESSKSCLGWGDIAKAESITWRVRACPDSLFQPKSQLWLYHFLIYTIS